MAGLLKGLTNFDSRIKCSLSLRNQSPYLYPNSTPNVTMNNQNEFRVRRSFPSNKRIDRCCVDHDWNKCCLSMTFIRTS